MGRVRSTCTLLPRILVPSSLLSISALCRGKISTRQRGLFSAVYCVLLNPRRRVEKEEWKHRRRSKFPLASAGACKMWKWNTGFGVSFRLAGLQKV
ncbi:hypothetical protein B0H16DRAFT_1564699 [Mycena metata]|uniref:Uncharacterized protein n=1 Tax=Mycena metata TaxID=1033252 RepID=A0AAD7N1S6_9AGAR|nr:hypothetical protein B0H16DRAFT_1564699 [Mycena metata]